MRPTVLLEVLVYSPAARDEHDVVDGVVGGRARPRGAPAPAWREPFRHRAHIPGDDLRTEAVKGGFKPGSFIGRGGT